MESDAEAADRDGGLLDHDAARPAAPVASAGSGGAGGTGGSAGASPTSDAGPLDAGGSIGPSSSVPGCAELCALGHDTCGDDEAQCIADCEDLATASACRAQLEALLDCQLAADGSCDPAGSFTVDGCTTESAAYLQCAAENPTAPDVQCQDDGAAVSCGASVLIQGGTFAMGEVPEDRPWARRCGPSSEGCFNGQPPTNTVEVPEHEAIVDDFVLDTFEVTVGRFREFVQAYADGWRPSAGQGANRKVASSGWQSAWDGELPADSTALEEFGPCSAQLTWTASAGDHEDYPINCVDWYLAFAFCIWDGGRLPTEAEWEYAATGGDEDRLYPWGEDPPVGERAVYACMNDGSAAGTCEFIELTDLARVGSRPLGKSRYGQYDLAGNLREWVFDSYAAYDASTCDNCAANDDTANRVLRGGELRSDAFWLRATARQRAPAWSDSIENGVRCARARMP